MAGAQMLARDMHGRTTLWLVPLFQHFIHLISSQHHHHHLGIISRGACGFDRILGIFFCSGLLRESSLLCHLVTTRAAIIRMLASSSIPLTPHRRPPLLFLAPLLTPATAASPLFFKAALKRWIGFKLRWKQQNQMQVLMRTP
jgi:hypothetical protein